MHETVLYSARQGKEILFLFRSVFVCLYSLPILWSGPLVADAADITQSHPVGWTESFPMNILCSRREWMPRPPPRVWEREPKSGHSLVTEGRVRLPAEKQRTTHLGGDKPGGSLCQSPLARS